MSQIVQTFQLGTSTVVTLPKKLGIKPGQKLEVKKTKAGISLTTSQGKTLTEVLEKNRGAWAGGKDWEDYQKRRKIGIQGRQIIKQAW